MTAFTPLVAATPVRPAPRLERTTFVTSRLLDFCSVKELQAQTGHDVAEWPLVIVKELVDNALDACEEAGVAPEITRPRRRRRDHDRRQRAGPAGGDDQVDPGLLGPHLVAGSLRLADARRAGQRAEDHPRHAVRARRRARGRRDRHAGWSGTASSSPSTRSGRRRRSAIPWQPATRKNGTEIIVHWPDSACSILTRRASGFYKSPTTTPGSTRT